MNRRLFLQRSGGGLVGVSLFAGRQSRPNFRDIRLVSGDNASEIERTSLRDAAALLSRALGREVPVLREEGAFGPADVSVGCPASRRSLTPREIPGTDAPPGSFRISERAEAGPRVVIAGRDPEGARNGLYAFLERLGFGFFRDGETLPKLEGAFVVDPSQLGESRPAFRWRGDMIWDNYLGPRRYCAAVWDEADWGKALVFMARKGLNFLEFYPPLEQVLALAFPEASGLYDGAIWKSAHKHALAKAVLARGRSLGIRFMYVFSYGFFPEPIRALYPRLVWENGFLCAHQPELREMSRRLWRLLLTELGTDHLYAIRHRGEEGQSYSDPCRSVTKAEGYRQAIEVLQELDPDAVITVWTWGEKMPDLFARLPRGVRAAHIRHGMAGVFAERGAGREQADGAPSLPAGRRWLSGHFTVFSGSETLPQTAWSDASAIARDARASLGHGSCEGFFQWPEWSNTSPWLSDVIARLAWHPESFVSQEAALRDYARKRHGDRADAFLAGFLPLISSGNARFLAPPRKRLLVPYYLAEAEIALLREVRAGAAVMAGKPSGREIPPLYARDLVDLMMWVGARQAHAFEAAGYLHHKDRNPEGAAAALAAAERTWRALGRLLAVVPELSILEATRAAARSGPLSERAVDSFWTLACDFYKGYPLVLCPEAIELVYLPQSQALRASIEEATGRGEVAPLEPPGWFWHDFPEPGWADAVRMLPRENALQFEEEMRGRLREVIARAEQTPPQFDLREARRAIGAIVSEELPAPLPAPP